MSGELEFKYINGNYQILTEQTITEDQLIRRLVNLEVQKENFKTQIENANAQIESSKKAIEVSNKNIELASEDLRKAYHFLESNHRSDIKMKIESEVKKLKEEFENQQKMQQQFQ